MKQMQTNPIVGILTSLVFTLATGSSLKTLGQSSADTIDTRNGPFTAAGIWIHPKTKELKDMRMGPFVNLPDGGLVTVDTTNCLISRDNGKSWSSYPLFKDTSAYSIRVERALIRTRRGTLILAFMNEKEKSAFKWSEDIHDVPDAVLPTYVVRSTDGGRTWGSPQLMHRDWTGAIRDVIEMNDGTIIFTSMMMRHDPGHHTVLTYSSSDDGKSWKRSNIIDLGGVGHHSGVTESTLEQLKSGELLMYMRTNWGSFWETRSVDRGVTWTDFRSTPIKASTAPGMFKRLKSGRLIMIWNQNLPQGRKNYPLRGGDNNWSEVYQSNHREELSVMFSDDEGKTWSAPIVIARVTKPNTQVSYPYFLERNPGEIWVTTMFGGLRLTFREADLAGSK
ncbi:MAG: glycoside hydrolase [Chitinophagaceae bacterium]|jgi:sialidase-1|nr:glycoside hydrolase [Chitinophagaceae bacterium]